MKKIIRLYCDSCKKETNHKLKFNLIKSFMDGAFMTLTKGWSEMNGTHLFQCQECGNIIEVELED